MCLCVCACICLCVRENICHGLRPSEVNVQAMCEFLKCLLINDVRKKGG